VRSHDTRPLGAPSHGTPSHGTPSLGTAGPPAAGIELTGQLRTGHGISTSVGTAGGERVVARVLDLSVSRPWSWEWLAQDLGAAATTGSPHLTVSAVAARSAEEAVLVRPYLAGEDIGSWAASRPARERAELSRVMREVFLGLAALHRLGLVHGGLKPANVWMAAGSERVLLLDALVSRTQLAQPLAPADSRYLAPEQAGLVHRTVGFAADLYAAGWVVVEALARRNGTAARLPADLATGCGTTARIGRMLQAVGAPRSLTPVLLKLLAPLPEDRYESAEDVLTAIEVHDTGEPYPTDIPDIPDVPDTPRPGVATGTDRVDFEPELVGRRDELGTLLGHSRDAVSGRGVVVCLTGQPGMGKSRLLQATASAAGAAGMTVLRGSAFDQTARRPLGLFRAALDDLAGFLRAHPDEASRIAGELGGVLPSVATLVPDIAAVLGRAEQTPSAAASMAGIPGVEGVSGSAIAATARLFELAATPSHPVLLIVDDCQWADDLSWQLLARIATVVSERAPGPGHLGLVCSLRPEALARARAWELPDLRIVRLGPLGVEESTELIGAVAGPVPDELIGYIISHSFGNPLYTLSTLRALIDSSVLSGAGERWTVDTERMWGLPPIQLPPLGSAPSGGGTRAEAFVTARLAHLHPRTRHAVQQGAVLGRQFSLAMLRAALDSGTEDAADTGDAVREALQRGILRALPSDVGAADSTAADLEFTHDRLRDAVLRSVDQDEQRHLHRRAAEAFGDAKGARYDYEVAYHLHHCGEVVAALPPALRAAEAALRQHALDVAETNLQIASAGMVAADRLDGEPLADRDRFRVHEGLGTVHMLQGEYDLAADQLEAAYRTAPSLGRLESGRVATLRGELAFKTGQLADAEVWTGHAMAALRLRRPTGPVVAGLSSVYEAARLCTSLAADRWGIRHHRGPTDDRLALAARLHNRLAYQWWFMRSPVWNVWVCLRALRYSHASGVVRELSQALSLSAAVTAGLAPVLCRFSLRLAARSLRLREAAHDEWGVAQSLHFRGFVLHAGQRYADAIAVFDTAIAAFDVLGDRWEQIAARWQQALCLYRLGRLHEAGALARETFWEGKRIGDRIGAGTALAIWVRCLPADVSSETVQRELELMGSADLHTRTLMHLASGWRSLHLGDFDAAARVLGESDQRRRRGGIRNHFVAPVLTSHLHALRLSRDARSPWSGRDRRRDGRAVRRRLWRALCTAVVFGSERPSVLREWAMSSAAAGRTRRARWQLRASLLSARRSGAEGEQAASCHVAEVALGAAAATWAPLAGLPPSAEVCRRLRLRVDRGVVEALSQRVMPTVAESSRHEAVLTAARRIVTSEDVGQILSEVRDATAATTTAVDVRIGPAGDSRTAPGGSSGGWSASTSVSTETVVKPITVTGSAPLEVVAEYPFGEAAKHEQTVEVLATLAGAVLERLALRRESTERIVEVQEAERGRIARDLHDELGHLFAGIMDGAGALARTGDEAQQRQAAAVRELAREGIRAVRTMAWTLRPEGLEDLGVVGCVEQLVEDCARMFRIRIDLTTRGLEEPLEEPLPDAVQTAVFRIIQEALTNVGRHAQASEASVLLVASGDRLRAVVEDNGTGFETPAGDAPARTSLGLSGMRERARLVGGRIEIESQPGAGTTVMVEVPVNHGWRGGV
jgi:two-component system sensor kinase